VSKAVEKYPSEPLKCWQKAKTLRQKYYEDYLKAHEKGGICWAGGAWTFSAIPAGLGDDVYCITSEPYGATIAWNKHFAMKCQEAVETAGFARTLCAYMRNYWGGIILDKYCLADGTIVDGFPAPDFMWQDHICCSHAKWYQVARELEREKGKEIPYYSVDVSVGPYAQLNDRKINYIVRQLDDGIKWMEKVTGRKYDDKKLIQAVHNECRSTSTWAEICTLNKAIPAPLDEKSMYSLYVLGTLMKHTKECADFYEELRDEVKDRVKRGIAAVPTERARIITDTQPPWAFLSIFRYLEKYGCVSVGSLYTFGLIGMFEVKPDGTWGPKTTPQQKGIKLNTREDALRTIVEWTCARPEWAHFYDPQLKSEMMLRIFKEWKLNGVLLHYNRGCEGLSCGIAENRLALVKAGIPVMPFEGNMGDEREFDLPGTVARIDSFMESLGLKKLKE